MDVCATEESPATPSASSPSNEFVGVCRSIDVQIPTEVVQQAWTSFEDLRTQYVLEGHVNGWIGCAVYVAVWQCTPIGQEPFFGHFSLSNLLKVCQVSVLEFFDKLNKWLDMVSGPRRLAEQVSRVQASLAVSAVVYRKYLPIFRRVFVNIEEESLSTKKVFDLVWTLYVTMKKVSSMIGDDLLNSFHTLLCSVDLIFNELRTYDPRFLNPAFRDLVESNGESVLENLCRSFEGVLLNAKHFRQHFWKPRLKKLFAVDPENVMVGDSEDTDLLNDVDSTMKILNEICDAATIRRGEMDERCFVAEDISSVYNEADDVNAISHLRVSGDDVTVDANLLLQIGMQTCLEKVNDSRSAPPPANGKSYLIANDQFCPVTPLSAANQNAQKLQYLVGEDWSKSHELEQLYGECRDDPKFFVEDLVRRMGEKLDNKVREEQKAPESANYDAVFSSMVQMRRDEVESLFYRLLVKILISDRERNMNEPADMTEIIYKEEFIVSLWAAALQIVLYTYESQREFPWCIDLLQLAPVSFYKIIELVIRAESDLSRGMVKCLNRVEERVLEELAWVFTSPLWTTLLRRADGVPSWQQVSSAGSIEMYGAPARALASSAYSRYAQSPMKPNYMSGTGKRRLEYEDDDVVMGGAPKRMAMDPNTEWHYQNSSTVVFFRKVYYLAAIRLSDLFDRIRIDDKCRQRVWTLFEHILRTDTTLMAGRHLDQNLMCCIYIVAKICKLDISFHDIMYHYRHQPQACSRVYRRVLLEKPKSPSIEASIDDGASRDSIGSLTEDGKLRSGSTLPIPGMSSSPATPEPSPEYTDLIQYYNSIFVGRTEAFVKRLQPSSLDGRESQVPLLSLPALKAPGMSPRKSVSNVNVHAMSTIGQGASNFRSFKFNIHKSPSKDLKTINTVVRAADRTPYAMGGGGAYRSIHQSRLF
ncbi:hypothetical protein QR680_009323 [Steinernema hermaphroditum]|uniref:Retinoblastoma-associated protein A-box domain-containing protein n=1 Tax=Steinernema hermaphroditum TaxID=289476 RepID=A0AA39M8N6_9BILA|nr:hypothetical protein QR680_009323 [Steinernema hermaphroditum]